MHLGDYYICKKVCKLDRDKTDLILHNVHMVDDIQMGVMYAAKVLGLDAKKVKSIINRITKKNYKIKSITKEESKYLITDSEDKSFKIPIRLDNIPKDKYVERYLTYDIHPKNMFKVFNGFNKMNATESENIINIHANPFIRSRHPFCSLSDEDKILGSLGILSSSVLKSNITNILYIVSDYMGSYYKPITECLSSKESVFIIVLTKEDISHHPCYVKHKKGSFDVKDITKHESKLPYLILLSNRPDNNIRKIDNLFDL